MPAYIKYLLIEKCRARDKWQRFKYPLDKVVFNYLKNKLSRAVKKQNKNESYHSYIQNPSITDWIPLLKVTKKLVYLKKSFLPLRKSNNSWATTNIKKAYIFAEHFICVFQPHICPNETHWTLTGIFSSYGFSCQAYLSSWKCSLHKKSFNQKSSRPWPDKQLNCHKPSKQIH